MNKLITPTGEIDVYPKFELPKGSYDFNPMENFLSRYVEMERDLIRFGVEQYLGRKMSDSDIDKIFMKRDSSREFDLYFDDVKIGRVEKIDSKGCFGAKFIPNDSLPK